jgi:enoyl-CoA hydratase
VGEKKAKELVMTGKIIKAQEAFEIGLINRVVPTATLQKSVEELVDSLLKKSPLMLKFAKMAINKTLETSLSVGLAYESDLCSICFSTEDLKEGAKAFSEKRKPVFKGK